MDLRELLDGADYRAHGQADGNLDTQDLTTQDLTVRFIDEVIGPKGFAARTRVVQKS